MEEGKTCSKCGSNKIFNPNFYAGGHDPLYIEVKEKGKFWGGDLVRQPIAVHVCADCGNIDFSVTKEKAEEMWQLFQKNKSKK